MKLLKQIYYSPALPGGSAGKSFFTTSLVCHKYVFTIIRILFLNRVAKFGAARCKMRGGLQLEASQQSKSKKLK